MGARRMDSELEARATGSNLAQRLDSMNTSEIADAGRGKCADASIAHVYRDTAGGMFARAGFPVRE